MAEETPCGISGPQADYLIKTVQDFSVKFEDLLRELWKEIWKHQSEISLLNQRIADMDKHNGERDIILKNLVEWQMKVNSPFLVLGKLAVVVGIIAGAFAVWQFFIEH